MDKFTAPFTVERVSTESARDRAAQSPVVLKLPDGTFEVSYALPPGMTPEQWAASLASAEVHWDSDKKKRGILLVTGSTNPKIVAARTALNELVLGFSKHAKDGNISGPALKDFGRLLKAVAALQEELAADHRRTLLAVTKTYAKIDKAVRQRSGKEKAIKNAAAAEKAAAMAAIKTFWQEWHLGKHRRFKTDEAFSAEAVRRYPPISSIDYVSKKVRAWRKEARLYSLAD